MIYLYMSIFMYFESSKGDKGKEKSICGSHHFMNVFRKVEFQNNRVSKGGGYAEGGADG